MKKLKATRKKVKSIDDGERENNELFEYSYKKTDKSEVTYSSGIIKKEFSHSRLKEIFPLLEQYVDKIKELNEYFLIKREQKVFDNDIETGVYDIASYREYMSELFFKHFETSLKEDEWRLLASFFNSSSLFEKIGNDPEKYIQNLSTRDWERAKDLLSQIEVKNTIK